MVESVLYVFIPLSDSAIADMCFIYSHRVRLSFAASTPSVLYMTDLPVMYRSLDFLYVDYKPPHPLDVIITGDVLSKYQRMFSFILRLLRGML